MYKYIKHIFAKSCIMKIYFRYIFFTKVRYIRQNIFDIYLIYISMTPKYIFVAKSCICRIYILCSWWNRNDQNLYNYLYFHLYGDHLIHIPHGNKTYVCHIYNFWPRKYISASLKYMSSICKMYFKYILTNISQFCKENIF